MVTRGRDYRDLLSRVDIFRTLNDSQLAKLERLVRERDFPAREVIFNQEDEGDCLYLIIEGSVRISLLSSDGREVTLRVYRSGDAFGEFAVLDGKPRSACATAVSPVTSLMIYREDFRSLLDHNIDMLYRVIEVLTERLRYTTIFSQSLAFLSATSRVAASILQLADQAVAQPALWILQITQADLAGHAGATREWTNQALKKLAEENIIQIGRGRIAVLDRERLRVWAGGAGLSSYDVRS